MLPPDHSTQTTGAIERIPRSFNRRDALSERRQNILHQKHTDTESLPRLDPPNSRIAWRQLIQLREENKRLRWELAETEKALTTLQNGHQQEIEHYESHLTELMEEHNRLKDEHFDLEHRYQELYHNFHNAVEQEAHKVVTDAARTIVLDPENRPAMMSEAMKTVELHVRQLEDKRTAEALYLMRQAQRKAAQLEQELTKEREQISIERQSFQSFQANAREQAELRKRIIQDRLRAQYTLSLTFITTILLILLPIFQLIGFSILHIHPTTPFFIALFAPLVICVILAGFLAYVRSTTRIITTTPPKKPANKPEKPEQKKS